MRLYATSDLHVDYPANARWVDTLSRSEHQADWLIVAGDLTHRSSLLLRTLEALQARFSRVLFVPGNHDLWLDKGEPGNSLEKAERLLADLESEGIHSTPQIQGDVCVIPLLSWYDFSFGELNGTLENGWMDFYRCRWPQGFDEATITAHFCARNPTRTPAGMSRVITFSHFLPRPDLFPRHGRNHLLLPILGTVILDQQLRALGSDLHIFGHSHLRVDRVIEGVRYLNNARGYPREQRSGDRPLREIPWQTTAGPGPR